MSVYTDLGLKEVINANGRMTILGASAVNEAVAENMKQALKNFVIIDDLIDYAGEIIAGKTGAEAGCPTCGAASAMAIAAAACIAGKDLVRIERLPDSQGLPNEIILQKGQSVNFGGNLAQMLRIGGGVPVEVGSANKVEREHIEGTITSRTAALFYVKSHHAVQKGMQSIETMLEIAHRNNLPLVIDAAAEEDMRRYIALGADLVIYSGGKALTGPTSGFIAGKAELIAACKMQYCGIGRAMKVSKEAMIGLITALRLYDQNNHSVPGQMESMQAVCDELNQVPGLSCHVVKDEAGREIYRAEIRIDARVCGLTAGQMEERLRMGNPAVYLRGYYKSQGILSIDPRPLTQGQADIIVTRIKECLKGDSKCL